MTDPKLATNGYIPKVEELLHKGYQPVLITVDRPNPHGGYQPTGAGDNPTNPSPPKER